MLAFPVTVLGSNIVMIRDEYKDKHEAEKWETTLREANKNSLSEADVISTLQEEYPKPNTT